MNKYRIKNIPHKTIERLSQYRRALLLVNAKGKTHIFSHEIAEIQHITAVQVRRDLMLIGYSGNLRKGYNIQDLVDLIGQIIDSPEGQRVAVFGLGNLGMALTYYLSGRRENLYVVAAFDVDEAKINKTYEGVPCYGMDRVKEIISKEKITIGVITVPAEHAREVKNLAVEAGVKGILNYTPFPMEVPEGVFLEEYDMITSLEKVAFYVKEMME